MPLVVAQMNQLDLVMNLYHDVVNEMNKQGNFQWGDGYPSRELIQEDIEKGELYVLYEGEEIAAAVVLNVECAPQYEQIRWQESDQSFAVVHRLCVNPFFQGRGIGRMVMEAIEQWACEQGYRSIRLDTFSQNRKAQSLFMRQGYESRGSFYFPGYDLPFVAFEKRLRCDLKSLYCGSKDTKNGYK